MSVTGFGGDTLARVLLTLDLLGLADKPGSSTLAASEDLAFVEARHPHLDDASRARLAVVAAVVRVLGDAMAESVTQAIRARVDELRADVLFYLAGGATGAPKGGE